MNNQPAFIHARATGHVQGVGYRAFVMRKAIAQKVSGWVRNCADGSVEAFLQGSETDLESVLEAMREGPPHSRVDAVHIQAAELEQPEALSGFTIEPDAPAP